MLQQSRHPLEFLPVPERSGGARSGPCPRCPKPSGRGSESAAWGPWSPSAGEVTPAQSCDNGRQQRQSDPGPGSSAPAAELGWSCRDTRAGHCPVPLPASPGCDIPAGHGNCRGSAASALPAHGDRRGLWEQQGLPWDRDSWEIGKGICSATPQSFPSKERAQRGPAAPQPCQGWRCLGSTDTPEGIPVLVQVNAVDLHGGMNSSSESSSVQSVTVAHSLSCCLQKCQKPKP